MRDREIIRENDRESIQSLSRCCLCFELGPSKIRQAKHTAAQIVAAMTSSCCLPNHEHRRDLTDLTHVPNPNMSPQGPHKLEAWAQSEGDSRNLQRYT